MWWWDPFGAAVFAFSGAPAAGFDAPVVWGIREGEVIDVGLAVVGPITYGVMDLAVGPGHGTAGASTAAIPGEQHDSVVGGGDAARCRPRWSARPVCLSKIVRYW